MAKRFNARRGRGDRKKKASREGTDHSYKGDPIVPGSHKPASGRRVISRWLDDRGRGHLTRRAAARHSQPGYVPRLDARSRHELAKEIVNDLVSERVCDL